MIFINLFHNIIIFFGLSFLGSLILLKIELADIYKDKIINAIFSTDDLDNPFDNKVLVIDEVHNMISMMTKANKLNAPFLYELIMRAKNLSLICLSGTPFINSPFELA